MFDIFLIVHNGLTIFVFYIYLQNIIGDLHNASLLIDDIEDNSKLRRGQPVAHSIYGIPSTINTANYVYFLALKKCQDLNNSDATQVCTYDIYHSEAFISCKCIVHNNILLLGFC